MYFSTTRIHIFYNLTFKMSDPIKLVFSGGLAYSIIIGDFQIFGYSWLFLCIRSILEK